MRDPKRIWEFCNRLAAAWSCSPDLRFGQLMSNVFAKMQGEGRDPFFSEEDEMIKVIEQYCQNRPIPPSVIGGFL